MTKKYWIYRVGDGPDPLGDAKDFEPVETDRFWSDPDDALKDYLDSMDFSDGYPQGEEYGVVDVETGKEWRYKVDTEFKTSFYIDTEFEPSFYVYEVCQ